MRWLQRCHLPLALAFHITGTPGPGMPSRLAPFKPLRAAHKTKAPGFAGGYLLGMEIYGIQVQVGVITIFAVIAGVQYENQRKSIIC